MRIIVLLLSTVIAAVLQYYLPGWSFFANARYPFLFAVVLYFGFTANVQFMMLSAIVAGGMCDTLSSVPLGYSCVLFGLSAWVVRNSFTGLSYDGEYVAVSLLGAALIFVIIIIEYFLLTMRNMIDLSFSFAFIKGIGNGLQALLLIPLTFWFIGRLEFALGILEEKRDG